MRKSTRLIKRFAALILVVLISIDGFAAVVDGNDGGAFITKQEFETMKDEFAEQLIRYSNSIDEKIDGRIAGYLAGIKIEKRQDINRLLDEKGVYGKKYNLYWNSKTDKRWMNNNNRYAVQTINCQILGYDPSGPAGQYYWGNNYTWLNMHEAVENTNFDPWKVANLEYVYKEDGVTFKENQIYYEKVKNYITWQFYFQFYQNRGNTYDGRSFRNAGSIGYEHTNIVDDNHSDFNQINLKNWPMTYLRLWNSYTSLWDVWKQCFATISQEEEPETDLLITPFSTAKEYIWDKRNTSEILAYSDRVDTATKRPNGIPVFYPSTHQPVLGNNTFELSLATYKYFWFPWQTLEDTVALKERKIKNLIDINEFNAAPENGVVVGKVPEQNGEITIYLNLRVQSPGNVYVYIGDKAIKNWKESSFKGKKVSITSAGGSKLIEYPYVQKNQTIWVLYEVSPAVDNNYKLFLDELYFMSI